MRRVLILAYYFPPSGSTAANRPYSWAQHLKEHGFYPVIITRNWHNEAIINEVQKYEAYEVHYVGWKENRFSRLTDRFVKNETFVVKYLFLLFYYSFQYLSPYVRNTGLYESYIKEYCRANSDIQVCIATGGPYWLLALGVKLKKTFGISLIADYRDPWSSNKLINTHGALKFIKRIERYYERYLAKSYDCLVTVSEVLRSQISEHILFSNRPSYVLYNGYSYDYQAMEPHTERFIVLAAGLFSLPQPIESYIDVYIKLWKGKKLPENALFIFLGIKSSLGPYNRVLSAIKGYEHLFLLTERIPYEEAVAYQRKATCLVMPSLRGFKGIPSSKLFDYVGLGKPIINYPNDKDIIEEVLTTTRLGLIANSISELESHFVLCVERYLAGVPIVDGDSDAIAKYSRRNQTQVLAQALNDVLNID
jgi:glycosyltransferase involved in cell wall biosynthesis